MSADPVAEFQSKYGTGIPLASGAEEEVNEQFGGHIYVIPAGKTLVVMDKKEHPRDKQQRPDFSREPVTIESAQAIVRELLSPDRFGRKGVFVVMNDGHDEERRQAGRKRWLDWRMNQALGVQAQWMRFAEAAKATPGSLPPVMPKHVRMEINFLRKYATEIRSADRKRFVCIQDGNDFDTYDEAIAYIENMFGHVLTQNGDLPDKYIQDNQKMLADAVTAGKRAREESQAPPPEASVVDIAEGERLLDLAAKKGEPLTRAEKKKLMAGDAGAIQELKPRIEPA